MKVKTLLVPKFLRYFNEHMIRSVKLKTKYLLESPYDI